MAELSTIARPYAGALFETARASAEGLEPWLAVVEELAALMSHPQVAQVVADPKLDDAQFRFTPPAGADVIGDDAKK